MQQFAQLSVLKIWQNGYNIIWFCIEALHMEIYSIMKV